MPETKFAASVFPVRTALTVIPNGYFINLEILNSFNLNLSNLLHLIGNHHANGIRSITACRRDDFGKTFRLASQEFLSYPEPLPAFS